MQKKLIAIVVALAMLLSTFGVIAPVFAAPEFTATIDKEVVNTDAPMTVKVTVKEGTLYKDTVYYAIYEDGDYVTSSTTKTGYINFTYNADAAPDIDYTFYVKKDPMVWPATDAGIDLDGEDDDEVYAEVKTVTKHVMNMNSVSIARGDTKTLSGTLKTGAGDSPDRTTVVLYVAADVVSDDSDNFLAEGLVPVASARTSSSGSFALAYTFDDAAKWALSIEGSEVVYAKGTVSPDKDLDVSLDKDTVKVGADATKTDSIEVTVEDDDGDGVPGAIVVISGVEIWDTDGLVINGVDFGDYVFADGDVEALSTKTKLYGVTDGEGVVTFEAAFKKSGTGTVTAYFEDEDDGATPDVFGEDGLMDSADDEADARDAIADAAWDNSGTATFKVAASGTLNISVTPIEMNMSADADEDGVQDAYAVKVSFWDSKGYGIVDKDAENHGARGGLKKVEVELLGCGIDESADTGDSDVADELDVDDDYIEFQGLKPKQAGDVTVKVIATFWDGTKITQTKTVEVKGWKVEVTPTAYTVDKQYDVKVVVTKASGASINTAWIEFTDGNNQIVEDVKYLDDGKWKTFDGYIDGIADAVNNGTYTKTLKFSAVPEDGVLKVFVYDEEDGALKARASLDFYGEDVYSVNVDSDTVIAGLEEDIEITAKDADGAAIKDDGAVITIDGDDYVKGDKDTEGEYSYSNGVYTIAFMNKTAGEYDVYFHSSDRAEMGKATLTVVSPKVELEKTALTDSVKEAFVVKVIDPRDDSMIEDAILQVTTTGAFAKVYLDGDSDAVAEIADMADEEAEIDDNYESDSIDEEGLAIEIMAWDDDDNDADDPVVTLKISFDDGDNWTKIAELPVKEMSITANPAVIPVDKTTNMVITVKDANDEPVAGKEIKLSGAVTAESETNADGKVTFSVKAGASGTIYAKVKTDRKDGGDAVYTEAKFQASTSAVKATISMQLGNKTAVANGSMSTLDVAPFAENGRTLVPFRYIAEAIGAYVEFIAPDKVVYRLRVDENTVNEVWLTIGSTVASVNGVEQTLEVAPKIVDGRTVVPLRFVGEAFGFYVDYNFGTEVITLTK